MLLRAVLPAPALRPYIAQYWTMAGTFEQPNSISLLPDGGVHLLLNFGEGPQSENYGDASHAAREARNADWSRR